MHIAFKSLTQILLLFFQQKSWFEAHLKGKDNDKFQEERIADRYRKTEGTHCGIWGFFYPSGDVLSQKTQAKAFNSIMRVDG